MHIIIGSAMSMLIAASAAMAQAPAQPTPLPDVTPQFVVSYIEVKPGSADAVAQLARAWRDDVRKEPGIGQFEVFQRVNTPHHFAVVGRWQTTKDFIAHGDAPHTKAFRSALEAELTAPYDERRHHTLNVGPTSAAGRGLVAVTHVDIIPTEREAGITAVKLLADQSRGTDGNLRYDALTQSNRPNHMTLVEVWRDEDAYHRHVVSAHMKAFRASLLPRSGSLYDERLYRALD